MNALRISFLSLLVCLSAGSALVASEEERYEDVDLEMVRVDDAGNVLGGDTPYVVPKSGTSIGNSRFTGYRNVKGGDAGNGLNGDIPFRVPTPGASVGSSCCPPVASCRNALDCSERFDNCKTTCCPGASTESSCCSSVPKCPKIPDCSNALDCSQCSDNCKIGTGVFLVCAALGLGFGFGFEPHTYKVYNEGTVPLNFHYRPGCTKKSCTRDSDGDRTCHNVETDCVETVWPGDRERIWMNGHLSKLCATKTYSGWRSKCATRKGLDTSYNWCAGNNLKMYRCHGSENQTPTNSSATAQNFGINFTDAEMKQMAKDAVASQKNVTEYLRGSNIADKWKK